MYTLYFSNIVTSFARDASCFVAVSNDNEFGDSRITGPYGHTKIDIVKLKGGLNHYFVVGGIDFKSLREKDNAMSKFLTACDECVSGLIDSRRLTDVFEEFKNVDCKPLSAGKDRMIERNFSYFDLFYYIYLRSVSFL